MATSGVVSCDACARTESFQATVRSSEARRRRIPAQKGWAKGSLDAQDHGEEGKARERMQLTGSMSKS
jgi:hypothetical protein